MISPFPPKKTGIADYSTTLALALRKRVDLTLYDIGDGRTLAPDLEVYGARSVGALVKELAGFDCVVYHIGNNPYFHRDIALTMTEHPGLAVMHDTVLYYLAAGMGIGGLAKALCIERGLKGLKQAEDIRTASPDGDILRYRRPAENPCLSWLATAARAAIVHNQFSAERLRNAGFAGTINVIPHLAKEPDHRLDEARRERLRSDLGIAPGEVIISSFGFLAPTKRLDKVFEALSVLRNSFAFRLLIVGTGDDISGDLDRHGLAERTIQVGYVRDEQFVEYFQLTDVLVNLRYPTMGESSGPLSKALSLGLPALVTDNGPLSELPSDVVLKIPLDATEVPKLKQALASLLGSADARAELGDRAQAFARKHLAPETIATQYADAIQNYVAAKDYAHRTGPTADTPLAHYAEERLRAVFP